MRMEVGGKYPLFLNLDTRWGECSAPPRPTKSFGRSRLYRLNMRLAATYSQSGRLAGEKNLFQCREITNYGRQLFKVVPYFLRKYEIQRHV